MMARDAAMLCQCAVPLLVTTQILCFPLCPPILPRMEMFVRVLAIPREYDALASQSLH